MTGDEGLSGEQAAFCRREHPRLVGALVVYTADRDLAEEVAQEVLARAVRSWGRVGRMAAPGAWVHRVAINQVKRDARQRWRARRARARLTARAHGAHTDPDTADAVAVRQAVAALPPRQRAVLGLRYWAGLSVAETAEALGCAEGTVKALTHKAVRTLRAQLGPQAAADAVRSGEDD